LLRTETTLLDLDLIIADDGNTEKLLAQESREATDQQMLRKFMDKAVVVLKTRLS